MIKRRIFQISLPTLITCLFLGSLIILPMVNVSSLPALEIFEADPENQNPFAQAELDDEIRFVTLVGVTIAGLFFSKSRSTDLDFQTACVSPGFPPPKYA
jgi:hypothetical protein